MLLHFEFWNSGINQNPWTCETTQLYTVQLLSSLDHGCLSFDFEKLQWCFHSEPWRKWWNKSDLRIFFRWVGFFHHHLENRPCQIWKFSKHPNPTQPTPCWKNLRCCYLRTSLGSWWQFFETGGWVGWEFASTEGRDFFEICRRYISEIIGIKLQVRTFFGKTGLHDSVLVEPGGPATCFVFFWRHLQNLKLDRYQSDINACSTSLFNALYMQWIV